MLEVIGTVIVVFVSLMLGLSAIVVLVQTVYGYMLPAINFLGQALRFGKMVWKLISSLVRFLGKFVIMIVLCIIVIMNGNNARRNDDNNVDGDFEDENPELARQNRDNDVRNRQANQLPPQPQGQRLYPVLPDINYNEFDRREANNNDNNVGNVILKNNNMNQANDNDDRLCIICFDHERNVALFPCGHALLCEKCTNTVMRRNRLCPVCQGRIQEYRTVYL